MVSHCVALGYPSLRTSLRTEKYVHLDCTRAAEQDVIANHSDHTSQAGLDFNLQQANELVQPYRYPLIFLGHWMTYSSANQSNH